MKLSFKRQNNFNKRNIKTRKSGKFFFKKKINENNYRLSKRIKYKTKVFRDNFIRKFYIKPIGLIDLFVKIGFYKDILLLKLIFIIAPLIVLLLIDNAVIAIIIATIDIFCCALIFSTTYTNKNEAIRKGKFDYDLYKYIKSRKETRAILIMTFVSIILTLIGHLLMKDFLITISGIAVK